MPRWLALAKSTLGVPAALWQAPSMTMTLDIPAELQNEVAAIPDLSLRVAGFLRHEVRLEGLRRERHSVEARALVQRAVQQAQADQAAGFDWDTSFQELRQQHDSITERL